MGNSQGGSRRGEKNSGQKRSTVPPPAPVDASRAARAPAAATAAHAVPSAAMPTEQLSAEQKAARAQRRLRAEPVTGGLTDVFQFYSFDKKELGHGHYGVVRMGCHRQTNQRVAIKTIPKAKVSRPETLQREIAILKQVDHPNIIKLYEVFEDSRNLHLVTELCTGGELFDRIIARGHYTESDAANLIIKIIRAVKHCHDLGICHRDLKPENFLFVTPEEDAELKIIDFGLSRIDDNDPQLVMTTRVGTPYYIAPEVLGRHYDRSCDMWSIGVIAYILLCGYPPFYGDTDPEIFASVRSGKYNFDTPEWKGVSDSAKDFINQLLLLNPSKRMTADQALKHSWLCGHASTTERTIDTSILMSLKRFTGHNKLKKAALGVIADLLTEGEIQELKQAFREIDNDGNGVITVNELSAAINDLGYGMIGEEVNDVLSGIDIDGDGKVDYQEFIAATMKRNLFNKQQHLVDAFNYFDTQKQGNITKADLVQFMGTVEHAQEIMDEVDTNKDGLICFEEFVAMMQMRGLGESGSMTPTACATRMSLDYGTSPRTNVYHETSEL